MNRDDFLRMIDVISRGRTSTRRRSSWPGRRARARSPQASRAGEDAVVKIDRKTGEIAMEDDEEVYEFDLGELGRIAAQAVKQVMMQKFREAERDKLFDEFEGRVGSLVNGTVQRFDGDDLVINLGRVEAYLPRTSASRARPSSRRPHPRHRGRGPQGRPARAHRSQPPTPTWCAACSSSRCPRSPTASSRSSAWSASRATAPDGADLVGPQDRLHRRLRRRARRARIKAAIDELRGGISTSSAGATRSRP